MRIRMGLLLKWRMVYGVLAAPRRVVKMENTSVYIQKIHTTFSVLLHAGLLGLQSNADAHGAVGQRAFSQYTQCPIPVVGSVRAGYDALAFEEDYGTEYASVKDPQNYFYLVVKGDSMEPRISDGDLALIHRQNTLDNGDLGVMVYGDGNGTLKKYIQRGNAVVLHPFNPDYEDLIIRGEELDHLYIAGKVVETKAKW